MKNLIAAICLFIFLSMFCIQNASAQVSWLERPATPYDINCYAKKENLIFAGTPRGRLEQKKGEVFGSTGERIRVTRK